MGKARARLPGTLWAPGPSVRAVLVGLWIGVAIWGGRTHISRGSSCESGALGLRTNLCRCAAVPTVQPEALCSWPSVGLSPQLLTPCSPWSHGSGRPVPSCCRAPLCWVDGPAGGPWAVPGWGCGAGRGLESQAGREEGERVLSPGTTHLGSERRSASHLRPLRAGLHVLPSVCWGVCGGIFVVVLCIFWPLLLNSRRPTRVDILPCFTGGFWRTVDCVDGSGSSGVALLTPWWGAEGAGIPHERPALPGQKWVTTGTPL